MFKSADDAFRSIAQKLVNEENIVEASKVDERIDFIYKYDIPEEMKAEGGKYHNIKPVIAVDDCYNNYISFIVKTIGKEAGHPMVCGVRMLYSIDKKLDKKESSFVIINVGGVFDSEELAKKYLAQKGIKANVKLFNGYDTLRIDIIGELQLSGNTNIDTEVMTELLEQIEREVEAGHVEINLRPHFDINESVVNRVLDFLKNKGIDASIGVIRNRSELSIVIEPKQCFEIKGHELEFDNHHLTLLVMGVLDKVPESILAQGVDSVIEFIGKVL